MPIILFLVLYSFRLIEHLNKSHQSTANQTKQNLTDWLTPTLQEPVLANALKDNNLQGQPIILLSRKFDTKLLIQSNLKNELPLNPAVMTSWLGDSWQQKYIEPYLTKIKPGTVVIVYTNVSNNFLGPVFSKIDSLYHLNKINTIDEKDLIIYQIDSLKKV